MKFRLVNPPCSLMANSRAAVVAWTTSSWDLPRSELRIISNRICESIFPESPESVMSDPLCWNAHVTPSRSSMNGWANFCDEALRARSPKMPHDDQGLPRGAFHVQLRDLPRGPVVLGGVRGAPRIPHVDLQRSVLEASEAPAVLVSPFIRRTNRAHALRGEVRKLLEQVVVDGTSAHDAHHAAHARG